MRLIQVAYRSPPSVRVEALWADCIALLSVLPVIDTRRAATRQSKRPAGGKTGD